MTNNDPFSHPVAATAPAQVTPPAVLDETHAEETTHTHASPDGAIIVGHDGSVGAATALLFALELADSLDAPLVIIRSWSIDALPPGAIWAEGYVSSFDNISLTVENLLRGDTHELTAAFPNLDIDYRGELGQPADVLVKLASTARMLVVGSRGLGGFAGLMLGSVSDQCVRHAPCPVVVVPHRASV